MKKLFILTLTFLTSFCSFAQMISLDDITNGKFRPETISEITPLADGESFAQMSSDNASIVRKSFKNGEKIDVLFDVNNVQGPKLKRIDGYIVSPDEKNILIETGRNKIYRRSATSTYYIYNVRNRTLESLSKGGPQECPKFSPDGNQVAFVRDNNIYLVKLLYNNAESQITKDGEFNKVINGKPDWVYEEEFEMNCAFDFSNDSEMIAWIRFDESKVKTYSFPWYQGSNPTKTDFSLYPGVYEYKYPKAGETNSSVSVHSYDIKSRVTRDLKVPVDKDGYIPRIQFTGEKDKLMVLTLNRHQDLLSFYLVNARSTQAQLILKEQNKQYIDLASYSHLNFRGSNFVLPSERDGYMNLYLYSTNGNLVRQLTKNKYPVTEYYGANAANSSFYYSATGGNPTEQYIYKVDVSGKIVRLTENKGFNAAVFSKNYNYFLNTFSDINTPYLYSLYSGTGKQVKVLVNNSALKSKLSSYKLGSVELFTFKTNDGVELNGWMVKPNGFNSNKKYPVVMYQYSGPGSQQVHNSFSNGFMGGLVWEQRLAQKGYIVVCVDGRGTGGRGSDFQRSTYMKLGDLESHDQVETALYLASLPYVDKGKIAIWGWSFGGFNTLMSLCEGRAVFNCGVAVAPVTDWRYYDSVYTERYMRTPQENVTGYNCSPMHRYQNINGDVLIIHGLADDNVHFQNTAELTEVLTQADIPFDMATYTNRNHSIYGGNTRKHLVSRIERYFDSHLLK